MIDLATLTNMLVKTPAGMRPTIFSVRDENWHKEIKRPVANAYALSTLKELEPMNDACSEILTQKFDKYVGQDIDLGTWVHVSQHNPPKSSTDHADEHLHSGTPST